ncbi:hypothetical protein PRIC1_006129 [Phytophthora ramorum]
MDRAGRASCVAASCSPQVDSRDATTIDSWSCFLQCYDAFIARELSQEHPQFAAALRQLERETRLEHERHSVQVLATLRVKDAKILELKKVVSEQREQLDVVLDELERREMKEDVGVQVDTQERRAEDATVQTEGIKRDMKEVETQTQEVGGDTGVLELLEKLGKELKILEHKNLVLERELQTRIPKKEDSEEKNEEDERIEVCMETLQRGVAAMNLSCSCVDYPLAFFVGVPEESEGRDGFGNMSTCGDLEHRLEAQAARLEHVQECLYMWRDAAVQFMKRQNESKDISGPIIPTNSLTVRRGENKNTEEVNCAAALRGALSQIRRHIFQQRGRESDDDQHVLKELAAVLARGKSGTKVAAKMVQKWAGWEAKHLDEMRALRQGFAEERAVTLSRRTALLTRIDQLRQRELDLQAEVNTLKKSVRGEGSNCIALAPLSPSSKSSGLLLGTDRCDGPFEYPQLVLRLATAEQSLLAKEEQLTTAIDTIRALSSCPPTQVSSENTPGLYSSDPMNSMNQLAMELQRTSKQKIEFFRRREKDLVNVSQYFQMEKSCLQLHSRLEAEQKHAGVLEAAKLVCEQERDELEMKVEKLETEAILANMARESRAASLPFVPHNGVGSFAEDSKDTLFFALRRLRLVEDDRKILRERLRHFQQQVTLLTQQRPNDNQGGIVKDQKFDTSILECVAEHHQSCVGKFKAFLDRQAKSESSTTTQGGPDDTVEQSVSDWEVLLSHYEALWIAFHVLYSFLVQLPQWMEIGIVPRVFDAECNLLLRAFAVPMSNENDRTRGNMETLELELSKRDEKILILQQRLVDNEARLHGNNDSIGCNLVTSDQHHEGDQPSFNSAVHNFTHNSGDNDSVGLVDNGPSEDAKQCMHHTAQLSESKRPILSSMKPQEPPFQSDGMSSNGFENKGTLAHTSRDEAYKKSMEGRECIVEEGTASELKECLAKCAYLASQNTKLTRRLRAEKESNKQFVKEQEELRSQLNARSEASSELQQTLEKYLGQDATSIIHRNPSIDAAKSEGEKQCVVNSTMKKNSPRSSVHEQEYEALREQLTSREQENLTLVQSLCTIKEKCAQMEAIHQKELRVKAAEHAEGMESYMVTVNETLSRIESDKHRLEDENVQLRTKLQQLEEDRARHELKQSQQSSKGTNTDYESQSFDLATHTQEKETLLSRVQDLELQLTRERKLTEVVEQKKQLENRQEEQQETNAKMEVSKAKQDYELRCEALQEWRSKLQHEFEEYQGVQRASQQESERRIEFLSACVEEYVRLTDATPSATGKIISTKELYDTVMELARDPPRTSGRGMTSSSQNKRQTKQRMSTPRGQQPGRLSQHTDTSVRDQSWNDMLLPKEQNEIEANEATWWKLRASKLEAHVRSAMLQNDTFEDTIRQLELSMNDVKKELSQRLAHEAQLVSKLGSLKSELATTKEQAASVAEKYQLVNAELDKRQGEATSRGDETQRARMAIQRKTELLSQQKAKVASLQQELEQSTKKLERLAVAEKQATLLQQKAKEHTQQLLHARQCYERCHDDNIQLSFHREKAKERYAGTLTRLKAARAENTQLRSQITQLKSIAKGEAHQTGVDSHHNNQREVNVVSVAALTEEARALKRRVLQKQDVIVSYKAKVADFEAQLERQRDTMVKLARTNRELQQGQRQRQQQEQEHTSAIHAKLEAHLDVKQEQLDGLRASVYDSFEAFVLCRPETMPKSHSFSFPELESPLSDEMQENDHLSEIKRWTEFSAQDLEELKFAHGPKRHKLENEGDLGKRNLVKRNAATTALREVEGALETNPEDCRAEICELLQCLCGN